MFTIPLNFSYLFTFISSISAVYLLLHYSYNFVNFGQMRHFWWFSSTMFWWFVSQNRQESRIENVIVHDSKAAKDIKRFFASSFMVTDNRSYIVQCSTTTPPFYMTFALLLKCQVKKKLAIIFLFKSHHNSSKMNLNLSRKWNRKLELSDFYQKYYHF